MTTEYRPSESAVYYNKETDDAMEFMFTSDEYYHFSVNGGERTFKCPVGFWRENWQEHWDKR